MKLYLKIVCLIVLTLAVGCKGTNKKEKPNKPKKKELVKISKEEAPKLESNKLTIDYNESKESLKAYYELPHIKGFYEWQEMEQTEAPALSYPKDLSTLSYEQLRLLRNEVFARNGYLFNDAYLRGYFNRNQWYRPIFEVDSFKVVLNKKERLLVNSILKEETKRKKNKTVEKEGVALYNAELIANAQQFVDLPSEVMADFTNQNFSIVNANRSMPFYIYDKNAYQYIPHYITTDLYLFILHKYFSRFLEKLDQNYLHNQLFKILKNTSAELKTFSSIANQESIEWAKMYNALALYAIGDSLASSPETYKEVFAKETESIEAQNGNPIFIPNQFVSYGELKARGHYTKTTTLEKYFRAFKWISLNGIDIDDKEQLKGFISFAFVIKNNSKLYKQYKQYISTIEKLAGREDNLSIADIINLIDSDSLDQALSDENIRALRNKLEGLNKEKIKKVFGESFQTSESDTKRIFFLSSTYSISGDIFSKLIHIDGSDSKRPFPKGLDVPAVFGNKTAKKIITEEYKDDKAWPDYLPRLEKLQKQFVGFSDWDHNYGFKGVQTALAASEEGRNYPAFMKTDAYNRKELSTSLSSWTHIKHDLILYQEKPFAAECGQGGGPEPPQHYSYVEPNLIFWESALDLVYWLENLVEKESSFIYQLKKIKEIGIMLKSISEKELKGIEITNEEYNDLHYIGGQIEYILLALLETDHLPDRERSMALIADVYAYNGENLNVAVGNADDIYTIVPIRGEYYIARGAVFSYFEFKGKIYDDEAWRSELENHKAPERPLWMKPLINEVKPIEGQMQYRYSGHGM